MKDETVLFSKCDSKIIFSSVIISAPIYEH